MRYFTVLLAFLLAGVVASAQVKIIQDTDRVHISIDGKPFTDFVLKEGDAMKPYFYPLRTASGTIITRHYPIDEVAGEPKDHQHHRGLWFGHDDVNGNDFWNNEISESYAKSRPKRAWIRVDKISNIKNGPKSGSFDATMTWADFSGNKLVEEKRTTTFSGDSKLRVIDLDITLTALTKVKFGDSKDGVLGVRLARELQEESADKNKTDTLDHKGTIVNAEGEEHEKGVWGKPSNWVDYYGPVGGETVGIAIFDNPKNSKRGRWHARGYGLFANNPFGYSAFTNDKSNDGSVSLDQGGTLHFKYRIIIHQGDPKSAGIAKMWDEYAK